uniref:Uncharacterized protein n=1 Tax=Molossus molossus TaxID=27622 RepID=A0A7J8F967_MOLMO|nr:hypothetical protein HJG59_008578 [Molossus molossus]
MKMLSVMQSLKECTSLHLCREAKGGCALRRQGEQDRGSGVQEIGAPWDVGGREVDGIPEGCKGTSSAPAQNRAAGPGKPALQPSWSRKLETSDKRCVHEDWEGLEKQKLMLILTDWTVENSNFVLRVVLQWLVGGGKIWR